MAVSPAANVLTDVATVKLAWGRPAADVSYDDRIQTWINLLSGRIEDWCGRKFTQQLYTSEPYDSMDLKHCNNLFLRQYPIVSVTSVVVDGITLVNPNLPTVAGDYQINYTQGYLYNPRSWGYGVTDFGPRQNIAVTYTAGYATIPSGLSMACVEWVIVLLEGRMKDARVNQQDMRLSVPDAVAMALQPYKRSDF